MMYSVVRNHEGQFQLQKTSDTLEPIVLKQVLVAFQMLFFGVAISIPAFLFELIYHKMEKLKMAKNLRRNLSQQEIRN